jgi:rod shape-determining protein MreC
MRVIWWLATVVSVSLISIFLSEQRTLDPLQNFSLSITSPLEGGLRDLADPIADVFEGIVDRGDLVRENERLKAELERLQGQLAGQQDAQQRIREMEAALGFKQSRPEDQLLVANVIAQDPSGLKRAIAIDRGTSDGLDEGMVVLSRSGALVGTVSRAYEDFAWVRLVTDPESAVNAQVQVTGSEESPPVRGVVSGDLRRGMVLDLLPPDSPVGEGTLITTSGLGGNYPRALLIGRVKSVEERPQAPFKKATVEPAASLSSLEMVLVLTKFRPARLAGP